jgi:hypothetical protein
MPEPDVIIWQLTSDMTHSDLVKVFEHLPWRDDFCIIRLDRGRRRKRSCKWREIFAEIPKRNTRATLSKCPSSPINQRYSFFNSSSSIALRSQQ